MLTRTCALGCVLALLSALAACSGAEAAKRYLDNGNRYFAENKYPEAIIEYRNAVQADDTSGEARYQAENLDVAVQLAERAVSLDPENATLHYHPGLAHAKSGDRVRGREAFEKALALNPGFKDAARELAYLQQ